MHWKDDFRDALAELLEGEAPYFQARSPNRWGDPEVLAGAAAHRRLIPALLRRRAPVNMRSV